MTYFIVYETLTGHINKRIEDGTDDNSIVQLNTESTETYLAVESFPSFEDKYVYAGNIIDRPSFLDNSSWVANVIVANGVSEARFGNSLPANTQFEMYSDATGIAPVFNGNVSGNAFTLTTTVPGNYYITFNRFPYKTYSSNITAT